MPAAKSGTFGELTAKGDLLTQNDSDLVERQPAGSDGQILVPDASEPTGLKWVSPGDTPIPGIPGGEPYLFGSDMGTAGKFYATGGEPDGGEVDPLSSDGEAVVEINSVTKAFSWSTDSAAEGATPTRWQLYKNGVAVAAEIITTVGGTGTNAPSQATQALAGTSFLRGDRLGVQFLDGTAPLRGNVRVSMVIG